MLRATLKINRPLMSKEGAQISVYSVTPVQCFIVLGSPTQILDPLLTTRIQLFLVTPNDTLNKFKSMRVCSCPYIFPRLQGEFLSEVTGSTIA